VTFRAVIFDKDFKVLWQSNDDVMMYTSSKAAVRAAYKILSTKDGLQKALTKQLDEGIRGEATCAVEGCEEQGKPQVCPYDGRMHRHGKVHYDCGSPKSALKFRGGRWRLICDTHLGVLQAERKALGA
jgi:hypothetical protein